MPYASPASTPTWFQMRRRAAMNATSSVLADGGDSFK
jgi:hypothetical protein